LIHEERQVVEVVAVKCSTYKALLKVWK